MSEMEGGDIWSKLCGLGGRVSTLVLTLIGEMQLISFGQSKFESSALSLKSFFWDFNELGVVKERKPMFHRSRVHPI